MRSLWTDSVSSYDGGLLKIPPVRMFPKPIQRPHPPIVFGGESDAALRRVADLGQGWYGFNLLPDQAAERIDVLTHMLSRRGRRPVEVEMSVSPYLKPARDADALRAYADAGVDQVIYLVTAPTPPEVRAEIESLGQSLLPTAQKLASRPRPDH
jgi:alkanesulfonate monooxygenase SsuD/methylene tetrahydromethanopterin reductase-like flavin-dependent oxidoreductase (luciferase family)